MSEKRMMVDGTGIQVMLDPKGEVFHKLPHTSEDYYIKKGFKALNEGDELPSVEPEVEKPDTEEVEPEVEKSKARGRGK